MYCDYIFNGIQKKSQVDSTSIVISMLSDIVPIVTHAILNLARVLMNIAEEQEYYARGTNATKGCSLHHHHQDCNTNMSLCNMWILYSLHLF